MKILQLTAHFKPNVGGVETHLTDLVSSLVKRKNRVFVLTYRPLQTKAAWKIYEKEKNLSIFRIPWIPGFFYNLVDEPFLEFLYLFPGLFIVTPFIIIYFDPDVIHAHGLVAGAVGVFWGKIFGKKVVISLHSIYSFPQSGFYRKFVEIIFNNSNAILGLSKQSGREVEKVIKDKSKVGVFTYWINLKKFQRIPDAKNKLNWKKFTVLFVGRVVREKGILPLLTSFQRWNKKINFVIIGTGSLEERVKDETSKNKNLIFLGKVDNEGLPIYYSASDVLIVPSIHEEGFGRVILESLSCGTPVIGSDRGAIPEAMTNEVGKLIDVTPDNIKKAVEYFYRNKSELKKMSRKAIVFARSRYSERNVEKIISYYK